MLRALKDTFTLKGFLTIKVTDLDVCDAFVDD